MCEMLLQLSLCLDADQAASLLSLTFRQPAKASFSSASTSDGKLTKTTRSWGLMPSFLGNGVPEYPATNYSSSLALKYKPEVMTIGSWHGQPPKTEI